MVNRAVQANHNILKYHPLFHMTSVEAAKGEQSVGGGSSKAVSFGLKSIKSGGKLFTTRRFSMPKAGFQKTCQTNVLLEREDFTRWLALEKPSPLPVPAGI